MHLSPRESWRFSWHQMRHPNVAAGKWKKKKRSQNRFLPATHHTLILVQVQLCNWQSCWTHMDSLDPLLQLLETNRCTRITQYCTYCEMATVFENCLWLYWIQSLMAVHRLNGSCHFCSVKPFEVKHSLYFFFILIKWFVVPCHSYQIFDLI